MGDLAEGEAAEVEALKEGTRVREPGGESRRDGTVVEGGLPFGVLDVAPFETLDGAPLGVLSALPLGVLSALPLGVLSALPLGVLSALLLGVLSALLLGVLSALPLGALNVLLLDILDAFDFIPFDAFKELGAEMPVPMEATGIRDSTGFLGVAPICGCRGARSPFNSSFTSRIGSSFPPYIRFIF